MTQSQLNSFYASLTDADYASWDSDDFTERV